MINNPELDNFFSEQFITDKMTPEDITEVKQKNEKKLKEIGVTGISDLLRSEAGVKPDQMLNIFSGLYMRTRVQDMNEIFAKVIKDRWIDGLSTKDNLFIETSINRKSVILNKIYIKAGGTMVKNTSQLVQDSEILEDDCGTKHTMEYFIDTQDELNSLEFKYQILDDGSKRAITKADTHLIGTTVRVRSLLKCASKYGVCATCFGSHHDWNRSTQFYKKDVGVEFNDFSGVSGNVMVYAITDDYSGKFLVGPTVPDEFRGITSKKIILNKHCHVGTGSVLLPGAILKTGASLGAMSMVYNRKMPEWSFCSGIPAKKISDREKIESLRLEKKLLEKIDIA
jgi:galactoside O-acetyltransferase